MSTKTRSIPHVEVPILDIDSELGAPHARGRLERRIVAALIRHLGARGFVPFRVYDGETMTRVHRAVDPCKAAMELIFNLDEASLRFIPTSMKDAPGSLPIPEEHGVLLVLGNGVDIVSDWNYFDGDRDGFNAAMEAFDSELYA